MFHVAVRLFTMMLSTIDCFPPLPDVVHAVFFVCCLFAAIRRVVSSQFVHTEMKAYRLYTVVPRLVEFIEQLTNCYVRLNRNRLKGSEGAESARAGEEAARGVSFVFCVCVCGGGFERTRIFSTTVDSRLLFACEDLLTK